LGKSNYIYIHKWLAQHNDIKGAKILDFGAGSGDLVHYLRDQGLDVIGADPYPTRYKAWEKTSPYLFQIENHKLPFEDESIDYVISNQVFEHIDDYQNELKEIKRVLKPSGKFLALFPVLETAYEVHSGIWGAYYLKKFPKLLYAWLYICRLCGAGLWNDGHKPSRWAELMSDVIIDECHYKPIKRIKRDWLNCFGNKPQLHQKEYLEFRLTQGKFSKIKFIVLFFAYPIPLIRAGIVISIQK